MKKEAKIKLENVPFYFTNKKVEALENAFSLFIETLDEYALNNNLEQSQIASIKQLVIETYINKKASYFLEQKLANISTYLGNAINITGQKTNLESGITNVFYYKNNRHLVHND